jgi:RNA polymerase sigma-70 factor (ECF subfamily)
VSAPARVAGAEEPGRADLVLVERVARGDAAAFGTLYDRYARTIYTLAAHALGRSEAEEIVQDVFLRLWRRAGQYDPARGTFCAWLASIAHHRVLDELRRRGRGRVSAEEVDRVLAEATDPGESPDERLSRSDRGQRVLGALGRLPPEQRRVLVLAYFGGLSQASIADGLGWPLGTVKKRTQLGLEKLRASLAGELEPEPRPPGAGAR